MTYKTSIPCNSGLFAVKDLRLNAFEYNGSPCVSCYPCRPVLSPTSMKVHNEPRKRLCKKLLSSTHTHTHTRGVVMYQLEV